MIKYLNSLSDLFIRVSFPRSFPWLARLLQCARALEKYTAPKRRIETDVMKLYVLFTLALGSQAERPCHSPTGLLVICVALHRFPQMPAHSL